MDLSSIWPNWGSQGDKPNDGKDYEQGDNVDAGSLDYLWYYIKETFEKVETALSNKADDPHGNASHSENYATDTEVSGKAGDPHGNAAHNPDFAVKGNKQPPQTHGNTAHDKDYITSGQVDGGAPDPHGNSSHSTNFLPSGNYRPVTTIEAATAALDIDITGDADTVDGQDASAFASGLHGNEAHTENYITSGEVDGGAPDPHGNSAHNPNFLEASSTYTSGTHGNDEHDENYITSGQVDGGAPDPHGNSSHSTNFLALGNYDPVGDVEAATAALTIDITGDADTVDGQDASQIGNVSNPHGNSAHSTNFFPQANYDPVGDVEAATAALDIDIAGDADTVDGLDASQLNGIDSLSGGGGISPSTIGDGNTLSVDWGDADDLNSLGSINDFSGADDLVDSGSVIWSGAQDFDGLGRVYQLTGPDLTGAETLTSMVGANLSIDSNGNLIATGIGIETLSGGDGIDPASISDGNELSVAWSDADDLDSSGRVSQLSGSVAGSNTLTDIAGENLLIGNGNLNVTDDLDSITRINGDGLLAGMDFIGGRVNIINDEGVTIAKIDSNGNLEVSGSVTENAF